MSAYISQLEAGVAAQKEISDNHRKEVTKEICVRLIPLEERLQRLLKTIPKELLSEGISLSSIQERLRGRRRGKAHPGELGEALRKLGFKRERRWRSGAGFSAVWRLS